MCLPYLGSCPVDDDVVFHELTLNFDPIEFEIVTEGQLR
jgi:hypothetical protein